MSGLDGIGVRVEIQAPAVGIGIIAIASEVASLVDRLASTAEPGAIDVQSLPMTVADRAQLRELLGTGEVHATIDADGLSTVRETAIAGVWWTEHRNRDGELLAELIEVCPVPEILVLASHELAGGSRLLRARIAALVPPAPDKF